MIKHALFLVSLSIVLGALPAQSACTTPNAPVGSFDFQSGSFKYCDGSNWLALGGTTFPLLGTNGSSTSPTYSFSAGTNTGIYSTGAGTIAFSTGGTQRMIIDGSGSVGIGTTSSGVPLHVVGASPSIIHNNASSSSLWLRSVNGSDLIFTNDGTGHTLGDGYSINPSATDLTFSNRETGGDFAFIGTGANADFVFNNGGTERVRMTAAGNLGIGTTTPIAELNVYRTSGSVAATVQTGSNSQDAKIEVKAGTREGSIKFHGSTHATLANVMQIGTTGSSGMGQVSFVTADAAERMRIDAAGNVGIGTSAPSTRFEMVSANSGTSPFVLRNAAGGNTIFSIQETSSGHGQFQLNNSSGSLRVHLSSSGDSHFINRLGIGTTSPAARFEVYDTSTSTSAIIVPRAAAFTGTTVNGMIRYNSTSNLFEFYQNGAWVNYTTVSDGRLKTNIELVTDGLVIVNRLNPVFYDWDKGNPRTTSFPNLREVGFIAQEVEDVLPEVVRHGEDGYRSLEYGKIVAVVVDAVKSLYRRILRYEERLNEYESKFEKLNRENFELRRRLDQIEKSIQRIDDQSAKGTR